MPDIPSQNPFIQGPPSYGDESPQERSQREQEEARAKVVSDTIDEQIKQDKVAFRRYQKAIKVLLLGQSESGQSTSVPCHTRFQSLSDTRIGKSTTIKSTSFFLVPAVTSFRPETSIRFPAQVCIQCMAPGAWFVEDRHVSMGPTSAHSAPILRPSDPCLPPPVAT